MIIIIIIIIIIISSRRRRSSSSSSSSSLLDVADARLREVLRPLGDAGVRPRGGLEDGVADL